MECSSVCCEPDPACHLDDDPTLADCCRRDLQEQKYTQRIKEQLLSHDRTYERIDLAKSAFLRDQGAIREALKREEELDSLATDSDEDAALQDMRELRLRQLHQQNAMKEEAALLGAGSLQGVPEQDLQRVIQEASAAAMVCHLCVPGCEADTLLDEILDSLAHEYRGTAFLRSPLSGPRSPVLAQFGLLWASGLVCFRKGDVSGRAPLESLGTHGEIFEESVLRFLRRSGALHVASSGTELEKEESNGSEGEESEWQEPCAICGRRYYHEHIRSVTKGNIGTGPDADGD
ncbi:hypothetical protein WJX75_004968 [Coccomyxa subellipsoidea]|uniref:Uncharacterized protein n=1 Tax=Coccomyxa subellipsoidea TaxID=248742 RepID=A0ABR2YY22_9CHLO